MDNPVTTIDLLRHGEPEGGNRFRGRTDDPLSDQGWQQMHAAITHPSHKASPWSAIISSPLRRCQAFAEQLALDSALPLSSETAFEEIHFGSWEGLTAEEIAAQDPDTLQRFWQDPLTTTIPGAESLTDFNDRVTRAWQKLLAQHQGQHLLLVTHGGVIRILLQQVLAMPLQNILRIQVDYACLSRLQVSHYGTETHSQLVFHGGSL